MKTPPSKGGGEQIVSDFNRTAAVNKEVDLLEAEVEVQIRQI